jgi:hypothetical protein
MSRHEEIVNTANKYYKGDEVYTFVVAAQWADNTMIEKVVKYFTPILKTYSSEECTRELIEGFIYKMKN